MQVTLDTKIGTIMRHAPARALIERDFPSIPRSPFIEMLRMLTLREIGVVMGDAAELDRLLAAFPDVPEPTSRAVTISADAAYEPTTVAVGSAACTSPPMTPRFGVHEVVLVGPSHGNPFVEVQLQATFSGVGGTDEHATVDHTVLGFYDGDGTYRVRFMPEHEGEYRFVTRSNARSLDGVGGSFLCTAALPAAHGPVRVAHTYHFAHADGTPFRPIGTTCYGLAHQGDQLEQHTLATLANAPFNKVRMCVFPKWYPFNTAEPEFHAYEMLSDGTLDVSRFDPAFFHHFEQRLVDLAAIGVQADLILFHPYDKWGYCDMPSSADDHYLRYVIARFAAFANVWWSLANEYDFLYDKELSDWQRIGELIDSIDPHAHLIGNHNGRVIYDHSLPWVTHASLQGNEPWRTTENTLEWREQWHKPVVVDECAYEGDIEFGFGNLTGEEMTRRFWEGVARGGYVTHGECFLDEHDVLWWGRGGVLKGTSPDRIAFLRAFVESAPGPLEPAPSRYGFATVSAGTDWYFTYNSNRQPVRRMLDVPKGRRYRVEVVDTWNMTIDDIGVYEAQQEVTLPMRPYLGLRVTAVD